MGTHTDDEHIHNQIVLNSVNSETGYKYHSNKASLSLLRKISDDLCKEYDLNIIKDMGGLKSIDQTTFKLAKQGKSWKVQLVVDLDKFLEDCKSKDDFIKKLTDKNYEVKYMNKHITITKQGELKGIRVDTLARQFGSKYKKENIEKILLQDLSHEHDFTGEDKEYLSLPKPEEKNSEWNKYEKYIFKDKKEIALKKKKGKAVYANQQESIKVATSTRNELSALKSIAKTKFDYEIIQLLIDNYTNNFSAEKHKKFKLLIELLLDVTL